MDAEIVVFYDNDGAGRAHRDSIVSSLEGKARSITVIDLPSELNGRQIKDVSDYLQAGGTGAELNRMINDRRKKKTTRILVVDDLKDFLAVDFPPREPILSPIILRGSLNMVYAVRGVGKTFFSLGMGLAASTGGSFLRFSSERPYTVTYFDGEMPASDLQSRLQFLIPSYPEYKRGRFRLVTPDRQTGVMPDLATQDGQRQVNDVLEDSSLIIVDNLSCLVRSGGPENESESWLSVQSWALSKRKEGRAVLFVHHANKTGGQRGTSKKEDLLDTVIALRRPEGYSASEGASFEVHFEKARHIYGTEAEPFHARLIEMHADIQGANLLGRAEWIVEPIENANYEKVIELANFGYTQREIAEQLGIGKSTVGRYCKRAKGNNEIDVRKKRDLPEEN